jgi:hypothetical protein
MFSQVHVFMHLTGQFNSDRHTRCSAFGPKKACFWAVFKSFVLGRNIFVNSYMNETYEK